MTLHHPRHRAHVGDVITEHTLTTIPDAIVTVPNPDRLVHLQFRRFAGCPVCNLHLRTIIRRHDEVVAAGIEEIVVFHSTADALREHQGSLPFRVVADPDKRLYAEFCVESDRRALLDPRAWPAIVRGVLRALYDVLRRRRRMPPILPEGGRYGLPADLLIDNDGTVIAAKYGTHADDQWSVDELLGHARAHRRSLSHIAPGA